MRLPTNHPEARRRRAPLTRLALAVALVIGAAACGSDDPGSSGEPDASGVTAPSPESVLGEANAATGEPVRVGFVSDGRTPSVDNTAMAAAAEATVDYLNDHRGGLAGRPIELVSCETAGDPGKATDCASQLVQEGVVITILPESLQPVAVHTVMDANRIPLVVYAATSPAILEDPEGTYNLANPLASLVQLPIAEAEQNDIGEVTVLVVDVPVATSLYEGANTEAFSDAGLELDVVKIPLGSPDISQQVQEVIAGDPTVVHVVGDESLCIGAINGLRSSGFEGPISAASNCTNAAVVSATGDNFAGVAVATIAPIGDESNSGIQLWDAIFQTYEPGFDDPARGLTSFITVYSAIQALEGIGPEITADSVDAALSGMAELPLVTGAGIGFRCNGRAVAQYPAVCIRGAMKTSFDAEGEPQLPYTVFGDSPIPG